jgi:hypothetical protein
MIKRSSFTVALHVAAAAFIARRKSAANRTGRNLSRPNSARDAIQFQARDHGKQLLLMSTGLSPLLQLLFHTLPNLPKLLMLYLQLCDPALLLFLLL